MQQMTNDINLGHAAEALSEGHAEGDLRDLPPRLQRAAAGDVHDSRSAGKPGGLPFPPRAGTHRRARRSRARAIRLASEQIGGERHSHSDQYRAADHAEHLTADDRPFVARQRCDRRQHVHASRACRARLTSSRALAGSRRRRVPPGCRRGAGSRTAHRAGAARRAPPPRAPTADIPARRRRRAPRSPMLATCESAAITCCRRTRASRLGSAAFGKERARRAAWGRACAQSPRDRYASASSRVDPVAPGSSRAARSSVQTRRVRAERRDRRELKAYRAIAMPPYSTTRQRSPTTERADRHERDAALRRSAMSTPASVHTKNAGAAMSSTASNAPTTAGRRERSDERDRREHLLRVRASRSALEIRRARAHEQPDHATSSSAEADRAALRQIRDPVAARPRIRRHARRPATSDGSLRDAYLRVDDRPIPRPDAEQRMRRVMLQRIRVLHESPACRCPLYSLLNRPPNRDRASRSSTRGGSGSSTAATAPTSAAAPSTRAGGACAAPPPARASARQARRPAPPSTMTASHAARLRDITSTAAIDGHRRPRRAELPTRAAP